MADKTAMDKNKLAWDTAKREGKMINLSIGQIKEVQRITLNLLSLYPLEVVAKELAKRKQKHEQGKWM